MPHPCRSAKGLDRVFPTWFTQCGRVWLKCHAKPRPCRCESDFSRPRYSTAWAWHVWIGFGRPETACGRPARVLLLPATTRSSTKVFFFRRVPIRQTVELAVRIFPATTRTFTKDTALSENGTGASWHVWINAAGHGRETAWVRHGMRGLAFRQPATAYMYSVLSNTRFLVVNV
jgi:hypothetical protein